MSVIDSVLNNATVTTSGSYIFRAGSSAETTLVYNITGAVSGSITFTIAEVDPSDENTVIGVTKTSAAITSSGAGLLTMPLFNSTTVKVSWTVSVSASIAGTNVSIFQKNYPGLSSVTFGAAGGNSTLGRLLNLYYNQSDGAIVANTYKRVLTFTVPALYIATLLKFTSYQNETAVSRLVTQTTMGSFNNSTNSFSAGTAYIAPQWAPTVQANITTTLASGSGNIVVTVGYTNESGVAGRTGTITIPKGSAVGSRWDLVLQTGDIGVRSIQSASGTPNQIGVMDFYGLIQLGLHEDQSTSNQTETLFAPGIISFPAGTIVGIEYAGGTVSKQRLFDALIQLVQ